MLEQFTRLPGDKARRYINASTGEIISRRQYDKLRGIQYEKKAEYNKARNEARQLLRPARGRKSALKKAPAEQRLIAEARKEHREQVTARKKAERQIASHRRAVERKAKKRVKKPTIYSLKKGAIGKRFTFNTYQDYLLLMDAIQTMSVRGEKAVLSYSIGAYGHDTNNPGRDLGITFFGQKSPKMVLTEGEFDDLDDELEESKPYFERDAFFMHVAFTKKAAAIRASYKR